MSRRVETRINRTQRLLTVLVSFLVIAGCEQKRIPPPVDTAPKYPSVSTSLDVDLLLDVTLSMQGFTQAGAGSYYQQVIPLLEQAVITGWRGKATFMRFGADITPLAGREYLQARTPEFYTDPKDNRKTLIERAIQRANPDRLTILVTDLFQDNSDVNQLSDLLKNRFLEKGLSVGVMGIRSQYRGKVYDVGPENLAFSYSNVDSPQKGRPFYLLALGSYANVSHYFNTLMERGVKAFPQKHALILSRFVTDTAPLFRSARLEAADGISEISVGNLLTQDYQGEQLRAFQVNRGKAAVRFAMSWPYRPLPYSQPHSSELGYEVTAWKSESAGDKQSKLVENAQAARALLLKAQLSPEQGEPDTLRLTVNLAINALPGSAIYRYKAVLRPRQLTLPPWVRQWDMPASKLAVWQVRPAEFDGATTFNLESFLNTLQSAAIQAWPPEIAEIFFDIRVDK